MNIHIRRFTGLLNFLYLCLLAVSLKPLLVFLRMRTAKSHLAVSVAALCILVILYSPLCSLSCAFSSCISSIVEIAGSHEQPHHCHSEEPQEQSSTPPHGPSTPADDSGNCPGHVNVVAVVPSIINANVAAPQDSQPVFSEPVSFFAFHLDLRGAIRAEGTAFRSPPTRAINSVLRI